MARTKSPLRRIMTARFLRWWLAKALVRAVPPLGRRLGFFPEPIGLIEAADRVLVDETERIAPESYAEDLAFLQCCAKWDSAAPGYDPAAGVTAGTRTVLIARPWIDIASGSILLPEARRTVIVRGDQANWNATTVRLRRPRVAIEGRAFAPIPTGNYFHLLVENAMRMLEMLEVEGIRGTPLTIVKPPPAGRVEAAFYAGLQRMHPEIALRDLAPGTLALPAEAVGHFPRNTQWEWPSFADATPERLYALFLGEYGAAAEAAGDGRLYLSRAGAKLRTPRNEPALAAALDERGFAVMTATDANHAEQIARFRAARVIVAVHGAGLTNLLFARPGARVVEIFPENFVKSTFWWLARRRGLDYRAVLGGPGDYDQRFIVEIDRVMAALEDEEDD